MIEKNNKSCRTLTTAQWQAKRNTVMKLTEHFTLEEMIKSPTAVRLGIDNTPSKEVIANLKALCTHILEPLRKAYGKPIIVTSGYRCPALNRAVKGAAQSQHQFGFAADVRSVSDTREDNHELWAVLKKLGLPIDQAINEYDYNWLHLSYSPRNRRRFFSLP